MWCFKGLLTFSGVLTTKRMTSLGTKVCFMPENQEIAEAGTKAGIASPAHNAALPLQHITLLCPCTNPPVVWAATSVSSCLAHPGMHIAADGRGRLPELALLEETQFVSNGSCPCTLPAATQAEFWQRSCFRWWHGDLTDTVQEALCWGQAYQVCTSFLLHDTWKSVRVNMYLASKYLGILCHHRYTLRSSSIASGIWKYWRAEPVSSLTKSCNSSHCGLVDTWWRICALKKEGGKKFLSHGKSILCVLLLQRVQRCSKHPGPNPTKHFSTCFPSITCSH